MEQAIAIDKTSAREQLIREKVSPSGLLQNKHTPFHLCETILCKISGFSSLEDMRICVVFNLEWLEILTQRMGIDPSCITFVSDYSLKSRIADVFYSVESLDLFYDATKKKGKRIFVMSMVEKQFDLILMNPPYQKPSGSNQGGSSLWEEFVNLSLDLVKDNGIVANVHPSKWRKPDCDIYEQIIKYEMLFISMHSKKEGINMFGAMTPFDWYILRKCPRQGKCIINTVDEKQFEIDLSDWAFLPNSYFDKIKHMIARNGDDRCEVLYDWTAYEPRKSWMSNEQSDKFPYPCVHTTPKTGPRFKYSAKRGKFFGIPKIVFGDGDRIQSVVIDIAGDVGITPHSMGIVIRDEQEALDIKQAIESEAFNEFIATACRWSQFQIDWHLFRNLRRDFWREFVD